MFNWTKKLPPPGIILFISRLIGLNGVIKSIYWNFKLLPFSQAINMPIIVSGKTKIRNTRRGSIKFDSNPPIATLTFGVYQQQYSYNVPVYVEIAGRLIIHGNCQHEFGPGCSLYVLKSGILEIGDNFCIGHFSRWNISSHTIIGNNNLYSWENLILDTDGHPIFDANNQIINWSQPIITGDNVWIGARCTILKGAKIPSGSIIATNSVVTKELETSKSVYINNKRIHENIRWQIRFPSRTDDI